MASPTSLKRHSPPYLPDNAAVSPECFFFSTCTKRQCLMARHQVHSSPSSACSSCFQPSSGISLQEIQHCIVEADSSLVDCGPVGVTASVETADTSRSCFLSTSTALPAGDSLRTQQHLRCTLSEGEAESCCEGENISDVDITCFLHHECWDDASGESEALCFNPENVFLSTEILAGPVTDDSNNDAEFTGCSAENGNWFLNDLESEGHAVLNEVLDEEWMAAAVANFDRINDTLDADSCVLHLLESDNAGN